MLSKSLILGLFCVTFSYGRLDLSHKDKIEQVLDPDAPVNELQQDPDQSGQLTPFPSCKGRNFAVLPDPENCHNYYLCPGDNDNETPVKEKCSGFLAFSSDVKLCVHSSFVKSCHKEFKCEKDYGSYPDPIDCRKFYICNFGAPYLFACAQGTMYDPETQTCAAMPSDPTQESDPCGYRQYKFINKSR